MIKFNVFIENNYSDFNIDDVEVYNNVLKITEFIFNQKNIIENSCLYEYKYKIISFDIVFVNNDDIHRINKEYRQKDSATDVITFAIFADSPKEERFIIDDEINLGEIIISLDKIKTQAEENNTTFNDEMYFIISHGVLHLLGFDHQSEKEYNFMVENQNKAKAIVL